MGLPWLALENGFQLKVQRALRGKTDILDLVLRAEAEAAWADWRMRRSTRREEGEDEAGNPTSLWGFGCWVARLHPSRRSTYQIQGGILVPGRAGAPNPRWDFSRSLDAERF